MSKRQKTAARSKRGAAFRKVTLQVSTDDFEFATELAKRDGYFGPEDCLKGILNTAIMAARDDEDGVTPDSSERERLLAIIDRQDHKLRALAGLFMELMETKVRLDAELREAQTAPRAFRPRSVREDASGEEDPGGRQSLLCGRLEPGQP